MKLIDLLNKESLNKEDIISLLKLNSPEDIDHLFKKANRVKRNYFGDNLKLFGNLKFSNYCENNCPYCSKREENCLLNRYRLSPDEIIKNAIQLTKIGVDKIILRSGNDNYYDSDMLSYIIYSIKQSTNVSIILSFCERGFDEYNAWRIAGADGYILRYKTTNQLLNQKYRNTRKYIDRVNHLKCLKRLGFGVGTGSIIGLPFQSEEDIADEILFSKEFGTSMIAFNAFIPMQFTPYQNIRRGNDELVLKTIAVSRIVLKDVDLTISGNFEGDNSLHEKHCLKSGINVIISDSDYLISENRISSNAKQFGSNPGFTFCKHKLPSVID